ncbi:Dynamin [Arthrobotrys entomopaga]|nr:Dynamin [Arthrobotrys entomopaga]
MPYFRPLLSRYLSTIFPDSPSNIATSRRLQSYPDQLNSDSNISPSLPVSPQSVLPLKNASSQDEESESLLFLSSLPALPFSNTSSEEDEEEFHPNIPGSIPISELLSPERSEVNQKSRENPIKMPGLLRKFSQLDTLESTERSRLFDTIDKFRELNISEDISLPQLVVVGDQSSGKSSLLEGLTEINFPVASDLCTRFATQIVLRRTDDDDGVVKASIIPGVESGYDEELKQHLLDFQVTLKESDFGEETFAKILQDAAVRMGIPPPGANSEDTPDKRFSGDILKIELSGPHHPHLTIVDVPGLFHNSTKFQTDEDRELIRSLIQSYIQDPRTIIMAVMDGRNNLANQEVFKMAREVDPEGKRTVGIITKCDAVAPGDEHGVIQIASNKLEILHHGWFVVKNRSTQEIKDGVTILQRHQKEKDFFKKAPWNRLSREHIGVEKLKPFLGHLLYEHVRDEFPKLVDEINKLVSETEAALEKLGAARTTATEQRQYLTRIANEYDRRVTDCLDAKLREVVSINSPLKIRTHIQNMNEEFSVRIQALGHTRCFKDLKGEDDNKGYSVELRKAFYEKTGQPEQTDIYEWIRDTYKNSRGPELPGMVNPNAVIEMFREQSFNWKNVARTHVSRVVDTVTKFNMELFYRVVTDESVRKKLLVSLSKSTGETITCAYKQLDQLVEDESCGILQTVNDYFAHTLSTTRSERVLARLNLITLTKSENGQDTRSLDLSAIMKAVSLTNEDQATYDIHDILKSYYSISLKRFTDNVILQVIERQLLGKEGPIRLLKSEYISGLEDTELGNIAREDWQVANSRKELRSRLDRARSAQEAANMIHV